MIALEEKGRPGAKSGFQSVDLAPPWIVRSFLGHPEHLFWFVNLSVDEPVLFQLNTAVVNLSIVVVSLGVGGNAYAEDPKLAIACNNVHQRRKRFHLRIFSIHR